MKILIACEFSGVVRDAFGNLGHDVWSCDLLPTEIPGKHIQGDVLKVLDNNWDMCIAHPPCTYLANSGVCWLHTKKGRWGKLEEAAKFFNAFLNSPIKKLVIENPIPHKYAIEKIGVKYSQIIHPWMFGHLQQKATCLWLRGLPPLFETKNVKEEMKKLPYKERAKIHCIGPGKDRWKERSRTFTGIAEAMASQWSKGVENV